MVHRNRTLKKKRNVRRTKRGGRRKWNTSGAQSEAGDDVTWRLAAQAKAHMKMMEERNAEERVQRVKHDAYVNKQEEEEEIWRATNEGKEHVARMAREEIEAEQYREREKICEAKGWAWCGAKKEYENTHGEAAARDFEGDFEAAETLKRGLKKKKIADKKKATEGGKRRKSKKTRKIKKTRKNRGKSTRRSR